MNKKNISISKNTIHKLKVLAKKKEGVRTKLAVKAKKKEHIRTKLVVTAKEKENVRTRLVLVAKQLALTAKDKESIRNKLVITAKQLAKIAREKEDVRRKLVVTAKKLAMVADEKENVRAKLAVTAKEKERVRNELVVTVEKLRLKAKQLAVTAKEKESIRNRLITIAKQLALTAREKENVRKKLATTASQLAITAKEKESVRKKLAVTAKQLKDKATQLAVTAKEKENVRIKLAETAKKFAVVADEKENVLNKLILITEDLEKNRAKDEAMLASIGDALVVTDKNEQILLVNKAFERILGWKAEEVKGKLVSEVISMVDENNKEIPVTDCLTTRTAKELNHSTTQDKDEYAFYENKINVGVYYVRKDKTRFPVAITVAPVKLKGKIIGTIEVFRDITKEKEIDKAKNEFVSLASHQLRTPLTSIKWHTELLFSKMKNLDESEKTHFKELTGAADRMTDIINSFLNATRIELGTIKIQTEKFSLLMLVEQLFSEFAPLAEKVSIELTKDISFVDEVFQDKTIVSNILQNLLSNAIKYTPAGGKITLDILEDPQEVNNVLIKVVDTGYGIPESEKDKIFSKMFRAENIKQKIPDGNGLGLYIIKSLAGLINGRIWFESKENKGTTFFVTFPKE